MTRVPNDSKELLDGQAVGGNSARRTRHPTEAVRHVSTIGRRTKVSNIVGFLPSEIPANLASEVRCDCPGAGRPGMGWVRLPFQSWSQQHSLYNFHQIPQPCRVIPSALLRVSPFRSKWQRRPSHSDSLSSQFCEKPGMQAEPIHAVTRVKESGSSIECRCIGSTRRDRAPWRLRRIDFQYG